MAESLERVHTHTHTHTHTQGNLIENKNGMKNALFMVFKTEQLVI